MCVGILNHYVVLEFYKPHYMDHVRPSHDVHCVYILLYKELKGSVKCEKQCEGHLLESHWNECACSSDDVIMMM